MNKEFKNSTCCFSSGAGAVIHTHSKHCVMVTLLYPGKEFRITHQEMIKGMKKATTGVNYRWVKANAPPPPPFPQAVILMSCNI